MTRSTYLSSAPRLSSGRRRFFKASGGILVAGLGSLSLPSLGQANTRLGVVSFPGPSISSHSKVVIKKNAFDKKHGWDLRWEVRPTSDAYYNDFVTGAYESIDFGGLNVFANLFNKGVPLKIVQATVQWPVPVVVRSDAGIKTVADLKGKRIAVGRASFAYAYVSGTLRTAGLDLEKDSAFASVDFFQALPRLQRGEFDAAVLLFEHAIQLLRDAPKEFRILVDANAEFARSIGIRRAFQYQAIRTDWLERNKAAVPSIFATYRDNAEFFRTQPAAAVKLLATPVASGGANLAEAIGTVAYVSGTPEGLKTEHVSIPIEELKAEVAIELDAYRRAGLIEKIPADAFFL